jgi:hypothetical protein
VVFSSRYALQHGSQVIEANKLELKFLGAALVVNASDLHRTSYSG